MDIEEVIHKSIKQPEVSLEVTKTEGKYPKKEVVVKISASVDDHLEMSTKLACFCVYAVDAINDVLEKLGERSNEKD